MVKIGRRSSSLNHRSPSLYNRLLAFPFSSAYVEDCLDKGNGNGMRRSHELASQVPRTSSAEPFSPDQNACNQSMWVKTCYQYCCCNCLRILLCRAERLLHKRHEFLFARSSCLQLSSSVQVILSSSSSMLILFYLYLSIDNVDGSTVDEEDEECCNHGRHVRSIEANSNDSRSQCPSIKARICIFTSLEKSFTRAISTVLDNSCKRVLLVVVSRAWATERDWESAYRKMHANRFRSTESVRMRFFVQQDSIDLTREWKGKHGSKNGVFGAIS